MAAILRGLQQKHAWKVLNLLLSLSQIGTQEKKQVSAARHHTECPLHSLAVIQMHPRPSRIFEL